MRGAFSPFLSAFYVLIEFVVGGERAVKNGCVFAKTKKIDCPVAEFNAVSCEKFACKKLSERLTLKRFMYDNKTKLL